MALSSTSHTITYTGNGSTTTAYTIPFAFADSTHVKAAVSSDGVEDAVDLASGEYTVTALSDMSGGTLTTSEAVTDPATITIYRDTPQTQPTTFQLAGPFPSTSAERGLDRLGMQIQELSARVDDVLALSVPESAFSGACVIRVSSNGLATGYTPASATATARATAFRAALAAANTNDTILVGNASFSLTDSLSSSLSASGVRVHLSRFSVLNYSSASFATADRALFDGERNVQNFGALATNSGAANFTAFRAAYLSLPYASDASNLDFDSVPLRIGTIYVPSGTYELSDEFRVSAYTKVIGDGVATTQLKFEAGAASSALSSGSIPSGDPANMRFVLRWIPPIAGSQNNTHSTNVDGVQLDANSEDYGACLNFKGANDAVLGDVGVYHWGKFGCGAFVQCSGVNGGSIHADNYSSPGGPGIWVDSGGGCAFHYFDSEHVNGATSATSNSIGTGSKTWALYGGLSIDAGDTFKAYQRSNSANVLTGTVTSYDSSTGTFVGNVTSSAGSGVGITDWIIVTQFDSDGYPWAALYLTSVDGCSISAFKGETSPTPIKIKASIGIRIHACSHNGGGHVPAIAHIINGSYRCHIGHFQLNGSAGPYVVFDESASRYVLITGGAYTQDVISGHQLTICGEHAANSPLSPRLVLKNFTGSADQKNSIISFSGSNTVNLTGRDDADSANAARIWNFNSSKLVIGLTGTITLADSADIASGTSTGTKIGTATTQKLGFWNATPIVQPASANQAALSLDVDVTGADTVDKAAINTNFTNIQTLVNQLRSDLVSAGVIKGSA